MAVELLPHQVKAVAELANGKVLKGGVGTGKTPTSLAYFWTKELGGTLNDFGSVKTPKDLYIFTTARKRDSKDWQIWAARFCLGEDPSISAAGIKVTVDSYNNMQNYKHVKGAFMILDEQRMVGSGLWSKTFLHMAKSNDWIMLSATPADKWEDFIPLFVANGFYKNRTEFVREHCVYSHFGPYPKLERYVGLNRLVKLKNQILVEMPYERHTTRHLCEVLVPHDVALFETVVKKRWNPYTERPLKDVSELYATMRRVVNSDSSRIEALRSLMQKHPRLIVFYNFDYELEMLRSLADTPKAPVLTGDPWDGTIWSKGWSPPPGQKDSRQTIPSIKSKYEFEKHARKGNPICPTTVGQTQTHAGTSSSRSPSPTASTTSQFAPVATQRYLPNTEKVGSTNTTLMPTYGMNSEERDSRSTASGSFKLAEWNGHKHEPVPDTDRWVYLVQYAAGAEAWNCTSTDAMVFYSLTYMYRYFEQAQGRTDRLDTPYNDLWYYILRSNSLVDKRILESLKNKKNFNETDFKV